MFNPRIIVPSVAATGAVDILLLILLVAVLIAVPLPYLSQVLYFSLKTGAYNLIDHGAPACSFLSISAAGGRFVQRRSGRNRGDQLVSDDPQRLRQIRLFPFEVGWVDRRPVFK